MGLKVVENVAREVVVEAVRITRGGQRAAAKEFGGARARLCGQIEGSET